MRAIVNAAPCCVVFHSAAGQDRTGLLALVLLALAGAAPYFGEVFARPFPEPLPRWDDEAANDAAFWAAGHETRDEITGLYRRAWQHTDATINALPIDAPGYVPWWDDHVKLFNIMVHVLSDTTRHAGHADILREQLDGAVGMLPQSAPLHGRDSAFWENRRATIERAARAADPQPR
jgi:Protein of unknown function (DUF664)/Tyrosine phosphatase family